MVGNVMTEENNKQSEGALENAKKDCLILFKSKTLRCCLISSVVSVLAVIVISRLGGASLFFDNKQDRIIEAQDQMSKDLASVKEMLSKAEESIQELEKGQAKDKENQNYVFSSIASVKKDLETVKGLLFINAKDSEVAAEDLGAEYASFITNLSELVKDGAPFDNFVESNKDKFDEETYSSLEELFKFKDKTVKSVEDLKNDMLTIGKSSFNVNVNESFWQRQSRIIQEKIASLIQLTTEENNAKQSDVGGMDEFIKAANDLNDGNLEDAYKHLSDISNNSEVETLKEELKERIDLNKAYARFKNELISKKSMKDKSE